MGFGVKLDAYANNDVGLRSLLNRASARVDAALKGPMLPQRHDFRGGAITNEQHRYSLGRGDMEGAQRRFYLNHTPIRAVSRLVVKVTNTQLVSLPVQDLFIAPMLGVVEITSLAMTVNGLFGAFIVPNIGLAQPIMECDYTYGWDFNAGVEELEPSDARQYRAQNQWWTDAPVTVLVNDATPAGAYEIDRDEGTVSFDVALETDDIVTAAYHFTLPYEIAQATGIVAAAMVSDERLAALNMGGLSRLRVAEIDISREMPKSNRMGAVSSLPQAALDLLSGLEFITVR